MSGNSAQLAVNETASHDLALVHASKTGDVAAFEELVKRYDRKLLRIAQHLTRNWEDAQDVVQEAFLKAFQHMDQFRENSKFSTWLIRITLNQSLMKLRERRATREVSFVNDFQSEEENLPIDVADWAPNPEELYRAAELREILRNTLQELGPGLRVVFVLRDIEGLSLEQTAEVLDLSLAAVKARSRRARLQLRERLSEYFNIRQWNLRASNLAPVSRRKAETVSRPQSATYLRSNVNAVTDWLPRRRNPEHCERFHVACAPSIVSQSTSIRAEPTRKNLSRPSVVTKIGGIPPLRQRAAQHGEPSGSGFITPREHLLSTISPVTVIAPRSRVVSWSAGAVSTRKTEPGDISTIAQPWPASGPPEKQRS